MRLQEIAIKTLLAASRTNTESASLQAEEDAKSLKRLYMADLNRFPNTEGAGSSPKLHSLDFPNMTAATQTGKHRVFFWENGAAVAFIPYVFPLWQQQQQQQKSPLFLIFQNYELGSEMID